MSAIKAVQTALYGTLSADATYLALVAGGVHNDVPEGVSYPHSVISQPTETPWHTLGGPSTGLGWNVLARVHTYSRYQGDLEALNIHNRIVTLLNFASVAVTGFTYAMWEYEQGRLMVEATEKMETRHMVTEFRVMVRQ